MGIEDNLIDHNQVTLLVLLVLSIMMTFTSGSDLWFLLSLVNGSAFVSTSTGLSSPGT